MNMYASRTPISGLRRRWQRLKIWYALRLYSEIERDMERMRRKKGTADRLIRDNSLAPLPLFDRPDEADMGDERKFRFPSEWNGR